MLPMDKAPRYSAEHEALTPPQYCDLVSLEDELISFKCMGGMLRLITGTKDDAWHINYLDRAAAEKLRDKMNQWYKPADDA